MSLHGRDEKLPRQGATTTMSQHGGEGLPRRARVVQACRGRCEGVRRGLPARSGEAGGVGYTHPAVDVAAGRIAGNEGHRGRGERDDGMARRVGMWRVARRC